MTGQVSSAKGELISTARNLQNGCPTTPTQQLTHHLTAIDCPLSFFLYLFQIGATSRNRSKLFIFSLTSSNHVFLGYPLSNSSYVHHHTMFDLISIIVTFHKPNHCSLLFYHIPNIPLTLQLCSLFHFLSFFASLFLCNYTQPNDNTHFSSIYLHFMLHLIYCHCHITSLLTHNYMHDL